MSGTEKQETQKIDTAETSPVVVTVAKPPPPHILVACMPKSGSSFLSNAIASYQGFRHGILVPDYGVREQELSEFYLKKLHDKPYVAQLHLRNSEYTQKMIRWYKLTPVILVRDLLDSVASVRDHIRKLSHFGSLITLTERHRDIDDDELDSLIVQFAMPWYISFYAGWKADKDAMFLNYTDVTKNTAETLEKIFSRAGAETTPELINAAIDKVNQRNNRLNKGVAGRGRVIKPETRQKLLDMVAHYPEFAGDDIFKSLYADSE